VATSNSLSTYLSTETTTMISLIIATKKPPRCESNIFALNLDKSLLTIVTTVGLYADLLGFAMGRLS